MQQWEVVDVAVDGAVGYDAVAPATIAFANDCSIFYRRHLHLTSSTG